MLTIKVLGPGCTRCSDLEKLCINVLAENDIDADLQKVTDIKEIAGYGIMSTPALIINEKVMVSGKLPSKSTLLNWFKESVK